MVVSLILASGMIAEQSVLCHIASLVDFPYTDDARLFRIQNWLGFRGMVCGNEAYLKWHFLPS